MRRPSARTAPTTSEPDGAAMTSERGPWSRLRREAGWHRLGSLPPSPPPPRPPRRAAPHAWVRRLRHAAVWLALAAVLAVGYSYRFELTDLVDRLGGEIVPYAAVTTEDGAVRVRAHRDGHFYIDSRVNGQGVRFLVDTGASVVALSPDDAERIGFDRTRLNFSQRLHTAGRRRARRAGRHPNTRARRHSLDQRAGRRQWRTVAALPARHQRARAPERLRGPGRHADAAAIAPYSPVTPPRPLRGSAANSRPSPCGCGPPTSRRAPWRR